MLTKLGVDISRLDFTIRSKLEKIDAIWRAWGEECVVTSTYEGTHSAASLHYQNKAIDLRLPKSRTPADAVAALRGVCGSGYDVVLEADHIHIEFNPK